MTQSGMRAFFSILLALGLGTGTFGCAGSSPDASGPVMTVYASPT